MKCAEDESCTADSSTLLPEQIVQYERQAQTLKDSQALLQTSIRDVITGGTPQMQCACTCVRVRTHAHAWHTDTLSLVLLHPLYLPLFHRAEKADSRPLYD